MRPASRRSIALLLTLIFEGLVIGDKQVIQTEGDDVNLPCTSSIPSPVDWRKQLRTTEQYTEYICIGNRVMPEHTSRFEFIKYNDTVSSLRIQAVRFSDAGRYKCIENAGVGDEHIVILDVQRKDNFVVGLKGQTVHLPCRPTVQQPPVDWKKYNPSTRKYDNISVGGNILAAYDSRFKLSGDTEYINLTINNVAFDDAGIYRCIENSRVEPAEHRIQLIVNSDNLTDVNVLHSNSALISVVVVAVSLALIVILIFILWRWRVRRTPLTEEQMGLLQCHRHQTGTRPALVSTVDVGSEVIGATLLNQRIHIACKNSPNIRVFDSTDYQPLDSIEVSGMQEPRDIVSCAVLDRLFISDQSSSNVHGCVWVISTENNQLEISKADVISQSQRDQPRPKRLSASSSRLLVTLSDELIVYDASNLSRIFNHIPCPHMDLQHAIESPRNTIYICFWRPSSRVAEMDFNGILLTEVGINPSLGDYLPCYLALDDEQRLHFADITHDRVVFLEPERQVTGDLMSIKDGDKLVKDPIRLHFVEDNRMLVTGHLSHCVQVFEIQKANAKRPSKSGCAELHYRFKARDRVCGLALLGDNIYVVCVKSNSIFVFQASDYTPLNPIRVDGLEEPCDIVSCAKLVCLYIADHKSGTIWRVSLDNETDRCTSMVVPDISTNSKPPEKLSQSFGRLLVTFSDELVHYDPSNQSAVPDTPAQPRRIPCPHMDVHHAIESPKNGERNNNQNTLIVCSWRPRARIVEMDLDGVLLHNVAQPHSLGFYSPHCLAADSSGRIYFADITNDCVVLLSPSLEVERELLTRVHKLIKDPNGLIFTGDGQLLFVYGHASRLIQVFDVRHRLALSLANNNRR